MKRPNQLPIRTGTAPRRKPAAPAALLRATAGTTPEILESRFLFSAAIFDTQIVEHPAKAAHGVTAHPVQHDLTIQPVLRTVKPIGVVHPINTITPAFSGSSSPPGNAKTPAQLRGAYGLGQYGASNITFNGIQADGSGQTIAIIDAYDDPNAASDLHNFSVAMGLPDPGSFLKVNEFGSQSNLPPTDPAGPNASSGTWEEEESLDIEYAHAMAPAANIILVECASTEYSDMVQQGVNWARHVPGVSVVSMSFGGAEWAGETSLDNYFTTPTGHTAITFVASTGDTGAYDPGTTVKDVQYPAVSPNVVAVGGTSLTLSNGNTGIGYGSETGWGHGNTSGTQNGSGGGISDIESQPVYQVGHVNGLSTIFRTIPDISAEADPSAPGAALYDSWDFGSSTPWLKAYEGGTSLAAPMWAGMIAVANQGRVINHEPTLDGGKELLPALYQLSQTTPSDFHDINFGSNGFAATAGYDLVTGIGSPVGNTLIPDIITAVNVPIITSFSISPDPQNSPTGSVTLSVSTSAPSGAPATTEVDYYAETNDVPGLQTTSISGAPADTLVSDITNSAGGFAKTLVFGSSDNGTYVFYALAKSTAGFSQPAIADSIYTGGAGVAPTIGTLTATSTPAAGSSITLTAGSLSDQQGTAQFVNFWQESNGIAGLQVGPGGDTLVGTSTQPSDINDPNDSTWSTIVTAPTTAGAYTYYAQSSDDASGGEGVLSLASADGVLAKGITVNVVAAAASRLVFTTEPASAPAGALMPAVVIEIEDAYGNIVNTNSNVTVALNAGSFDAGSNTTVAANGGVATFNNLTVDSAGMFTMTATDGALAATSTSFTIGNAATLTASVSTGNSSSAVPGQNFTFTITISNTGATLAAGASVAAIVPADFLTSSFFASDNGQGASGYTPSGHGAIHDTVNLPAGSTITYTFVGMVDPAATGTLACTAAVSTSAGEFNPAANVNGSNTTNQNSASLPLTPVADVTVALNGSDPLSVGSIDVYTLLIRNNGPSAITGSAGSAGLTIADAFPSLTAVVYSSTVLYGTAAGNTQGAVPALGLGLDDMVTMGVGAVIQYSVTGTVAAGAPATLTDTLTATLPAGTSDPTSVSNVNGVSVSAAVNPGLTGSVLSRSLFYADSSYDGANPATTPTTADFTAIAPDKVALMPGQSANFSNYSSYVDGINGIFLDMLGDNPAGLTAADFEVTIGNTSTPGTGSAPGSGWSLVGVAPVVTAFPAAGTAGSDRIALSWPDSTLSGQWIQVTVLADANTGLATPDVFYFGSAPGESGNSTTDTLVNAVDQLSVRSDLRSFLNPASIADPNDFTRDTLVNAADVIVARIGGTSVLNELDLISVPGLPNNAGVSSPATIVAPAPIASTTASPSSSAAKSTSILPPVLNSNTSDPLTPGPEDQHLEALIQLVNVLQ